MLDADSIYTVVVMDDAGELKVVCLMDSAGSKVMPTGNADMGFGGTAPRPGAPLLPWLAAAAAGLLAAAAGCCGCAAAAGLPRMRADQAADPGRHSSPIRVVRRPLAAVVLACGLLGAGTGLAGLALASQNGHRAGPAGGAAVVPVRRPPGAGARAVAAAGGPAGPADHPVHRGADRG